MIKINVKVKTNPWHKKVKSPKKYFKSKLKKISKIVPFFIPKNLKLIKKKDYYIGDIATSYEIINSRSKKSNFFNEFDKVWIHGFLHLIGYDHIKNKDYYKMSKVEKRILNLI